MILPVIQTPVKAHLLTLVEKKTSKEYATTKTTITPITTIDFNNKNNP